MPSQTSCIYYLLWLATLAIALTATIKPTRSQPIVPNGDTNTSVTQNGNELEITGGKQSDNGANLFHSFEQFGLNENQIANFVSNPNIENILGRINGGDPSIINGLIKLTGGNSNLFLMNPAGIVFGSGASLNVPGSFMATTADRIGLKESLGVRWFYASGEHDYADLIGTPNRFAFTMPEPGTILNAGNLSVGEGQNLTLLAGTILNFGTLSAGGHITVAAVPGESLVRISQTGHLLSLEVENYDWEGIRQNPNEGFPIEPLSVPELLTGPGGTHATQVQQNEDGTLTLSGSGMEISAGDVVTTNEMTASTGIVLGRDRLIALASDVQTDGILHLEATETVQLQEMEAGAGSATIRSRGEIAIGESQLHIDGNLTLDAEETVQFHDSEAHPLQLDAGGNVEIRAANGIEIDLSNHSQSQWQTQGNLSFFSDGIIALNGVFHSGGHLSILDTSSNPTAFTSADGLTLNAQGDAIGGDYSGVSLKIETDGKIQTGDIEITASETSTTGESPSTELSLDSESNILVGDLTLEGSETPLTARATGEIQTGAIASQGGNISLTSGENLQAEAIASQGGNISLTSLNGAIATQSLDASSASQTGGSISLTAPDSITPGNLTTNDNHIRLDGPIALTDSRTFRTLTADSPADTGGNLTITGTINGNFPLSLDTGAGDVVIEESIGNETPLARLSVRGNNISFHSRVVAEGEIAIAATGTANLRESLQTRGERVQISGGGSVSSADIRTPGGNIELDSQTSQITTGNLNSSSDSGDGGDVGVRAESGISSEAIATDSTTGKGGDVTLTSNRNDIEITSINAEGETQGGNVAIETTGAVRAIGSFTAKNGVEASISTAATEGGAIAIRHGETTFEIGDANQDDTLSNGTTAAITTGSGDTLTTGQTLSQPSIQLSPIPTEQPAESEESNNAENDTASESEQTDNSDNSENDTASESEQTDNSDNSENDTASESEQTDNSDNSENDTASESEQTDNSAKEQPTESEQTENSDNSTTEQPTQSEQTENSDNSTTEQPSESQPRETANPAQNGDKEGRAPEEEQPIPVARLEEPQSTPTSVEEPTESEETSGTPIAEDEVPVAESDTPEVELSPVPHRDEAPQVAEPAPNAETQTPPEPIVNPEAPVVGEPVASEPPGSDPLVLPETSAKIPAPDLPETPIAVEDFSPQPVSVSEGRSASSDIPASDNTASATSTGEMREIISPEIGRRDIEGWSEPVNPEVPEVRIEMEAVENSPVATQVQLPESPSTEASAPPAVSDAADATAIAPRVSASPTTTPNSQTSVTPEAPTRASASAPGAIAPASQPRASANLSVPHIETLRTQEFSDSLGVTLPQEALSVVNLRESLAGVARQTNLNPAVVYAIAHPQELQLVVITPDGLPITRSIPAASRSALRGKVTELLSEITNPHKTNTKSYLSAAVQLYQWLIAPIEAELQGRNVDLLMFSLDAGLRGIPLAALHDGEQFLIEKYRLGLIPSVTLTDARYKNLNNSRVLAMGASEFKNPAIERLNAVPLELSFIGEKFKGAEYYLNEEFTPENLRDRRERKSFDIVHLATHVKFSSSGDAPQNRSDDIRGESYIQFWNRPVPFDEIPHLGFQKGTVELLVLSACETAVGNQDAELGFAGLAVKMGVKSVLASLWQVDDDGTLALMSEFYRHLRTQDKTIKAEALRQAQLAMLRGEVTVEEGRLRGTGEELELPPEIAARFGDRRLSHPYFWASFTLIGSPW